MSKYAHKYGKPESVLKFNNDQIEINLEPLKKLFLHNEVKNRQIVAFSTIGAYRKGKSFLLNYCLRFCYANYKSINYPKNPLNNEANWMGDEDEPLSGFSWRSGSIRDTSGIIFWNDAFLYTNPRTGEKLAIIVMDTQGLFDQETSNLNNSRIFALGSLISSIQILNLNDVVHEDQLQYLQFATEYAKFASNNCSSEKPFQSLMFLIRDWVYISDHEYGIIGGMNYMKTFLHTKCQIEEIKAVRNHIYDTFENLSCALLPPPGNFVVGLEGPYDGNWGKMGKKFKEELEKLINHLLNPMNLVVKRANGEIITGSQYYEIVKEYFKNFNSGKLPEPQSILQATIEQQMKFVTDECLSVYKKRVLIGKNKIKIQSEIPNLHNASKEVALDEYKIARKLGGEKYEKKFLILLDNQIEAFYTEWSIKQNLELLKEEVKKAKEDLWEKETFYKEQLKAKEEAANHLLEIEKNKLKLEKEEYERQKNEAEERLKAEKARTKELEEKNKRQYGGILEYLIELFMSIF